METKKRKKFCYKKFASFNDKTNRFTCLVETCKKVLSAASNSNLKRHYKLVHNMIIDENGTKFVMKKNTNKLNITMSRGEFLECCVGLVSKKNLPFHVFDDKDFFKKIIEPYEEKFEIYLNSKNIACMLDDASLQIKGAIAEIVRNKMVCLKIDFASRQNKHILGINIQYINDFKIYTNTIGIIQLNSKHTAQYIKKEILKCLEEYSIDIKQIYSNTTDNGASAVRVSKLLQEMQEATSDDAELDNVNLTYDIIEDKLSSVFSVDRCAAHAIQLAAYDVIITLETEIKKVRGAVKKIRNMIRTGNQDITLPCLDNTTRWNSMYDMISSVIGLKEYISELDDSRNITVNWIFVESFTTAFKPLAEWTIHMQREQYIIGDFYRDWLECELELLDIIQTNTIAEALHKAMVMRKHELLKNDAFVAALYLDPRFNFQETPLLTNDQKQTAMKHLLKTYEMINHITNSTSWQDDKDNNSISDYSSTLDITPSTSTAAHSKLAQHINNLVDINNQNHHQPSATQSYHLKTELLALCEQKMEPLQIDVLEYWKNNYQHNIKLRQLATVVLAIPATQVSVEHAFSALTVLTELSFKLSKQSLSNILITKLNFDLLDFSALKIIKYEINE